MAMNRVHPPEYQPGQPLEITLVLEAAGNPQITALGVRETIPDGWQFTGVRGADGPPPGIYPEPGAGPWLEFAWITPPSLPYRFSYSVWVPESEGGSRQISGDIEYRLNNGPHYAGPVVSGLQAPDPAKPVILLKGDNPMFLRVGDPWSDPGCTALDHKNADITSRVVVSGSVDTSRPGEYQLLYYVSSEDGTQSAQALRIVRVVSSPEPGTPPGIAPPLPEPPDPLSSGGRERSNPLAASTRENPAVPSTDRTPGTQGDTGTTLSQGELSFPDLSGYRPAPVESAGERGEKGTGNLGEKRQPRDTSTHGKQPPTSALPEHSISPEHAALQESRVPTAHASQESNKAASALETGTASEKPVLPPGLTWRMLITGMAVLCLAGFGFAIFNRLRTPRNRK